MSTRQRTILVVDDEPNICHVVAQALERRGFRVLTAMNGPDAVAMTDAAAEAIDLLIADVVMPKQSGPELARAVQARHPGVAVLFTSGYPGHITLSATFPRDTGFLQKPFTVDELLEAVAAALP